jgi:hypothetical protein
MPESDVVAKIPRAVSLDQIVIAKRRWGVSASALAYRLNKLSVLSDWIYRGIVIEIGRRGYRTEEPNEMEREESLLWKKVLGDLWSKKITKKDIAKELAVPIEEIENLVFGLVLRKGTTPEERQRGVGQPGLRLIKDGV